MAYIYVSSQNVIVLVKQFFSIRFNIYNGARPSETVPQGAQVRWYTYYLIFHVLFFIVKCT